MSAVRMDGKALSAKVRSSILAETEELKKKGVTPGLAVIIVGNDPASEIYVRNKEKACAECGFYSEKYALPAETTQEELLGLIDQLNKSPQISGILCQMPVPDHISEQAVIDAIDPKKDVDAFHPVNVGKIMVGNFDFVPCTPAGVMELLDEYQIDIKGKECVVVGRSNIVGKPMSMLLRIWPAASGCRAMDSAALPVAMAMPTPARVLGTIATAAAIALVIMISS